MKKSFSIFKGAAFSKLGLLPFFMAFLFVAGMQVDMKAQASGTLPGSGMTPANRVLYDLPAGPFVTVPVAEQRLMGAMLGFKHTMEQHAEGTAPYNAALRTLTYYNGITESLKAGSTVAESIVAGLGAINNAVSGALTAEELLAEKNGAINLLKL